MNSLIKNKIFDTNHLTEVKTPMYVGVEGIEVNLVSRPNNPYRGMVDMALATWGSDIESWSKLSPEERFSVVKRVMLRKALPLGKESPSFLFSISGVTRSAFDQIARQRIGSTFSSLGWNNIHTENGFRISNEVSKNFSRSEIENFVNCSKKIYSDMIKSGISWQSAREVLPIGLLHWFHFNVTFEALVSFCNRRLVFCEKEDTVATAWLMRERVREIFPYLASFLRPSCDWAKKCHYHSEDSLPEEMGTLFMPCGRNPLTMNNKPNVDFNRPSTDVNDLKSQLHINIPESSEDLPVNKYEDLDSKDKELFNEC